MSSTTTNNVPTRAHRTGSIGSDRNDRAGKRSRRQQAKPEQTTEPRQRDFHPCWIPSLSYDDVPGSDGRLFDLKLVNSSGPTIARISVPDWITDKALFQFKLLLLHAPELWRALRGAVERTEDIDTAPEASRAFTLLFSAAVGNPLGRNALAERDETERAVSELTAAGPSER